MTRKASKVRMVLLYGLALGVLLSVMAWSRYRFMVIDHALEAYVLLVAILFVGVGIWVGLRWSAPVIVEKTVVVSVPVVPLQPAPQVLAQLGISSRELEVLDQLAQGCSNEEIASHLFVSTNTVKTHLSNLYAKLDVKRRTQAVDKARSLGLIR
ncbi:LuxR family transcriptional regulator, maltose regulon positive regulatory protein [Fibrisoma limi BUZ 3]|uniref:LuxR family transcriptional regulator, maltose regulon positive regulatory protein n=1 Tax=Fibrisoma limi BUZ 3 TaxID=1185876 RepID=I2GN59_9BACT|nr:LuxR C-terminal-related transcriptional regulator [Fibrisoma limi]CCH55337.1 LuxR family transcriptional regulator, maltose regulon positive regulatory protein [Fibrisoma limi BUZ 3]